MNITFNKNSWHYKYFNWITGMEPPKSLCPYFWITVAITILLPIILLVNFILYVNKKIFTKKEKKPNFLKTEAEIKFQRKKTKFYNKLGDLFINFILFIIGPLLVLYILFSTVFMVYIIPFDVLWTLILIFASLLVGVTIIYNFLKEISEVFKYLNPFNWTITIICWEIIKSVYKKACPLIKWEE